MSYQVTITTQDGQETEVETRLDSVSVGEKDGAVLVCASWCRLDLAQDPAGSEVLGRVWPGQDRLTLSTDAEDVFWGSVVKVEHGRAYVTVEAKGDHDPAPDALSVRTDADEQDPMTVRVTVDNKGHGPVSVHFGDGTPAVDDNGDGVGHTVHTYALEGTYTLTVTDKNEPSRNRSTGVTVPFGS